MKYLIKILSVTLCLVIFFTIPLNAFAASSNAPNAEEYIRFIPNRERIATNGDFEFSINSDLTSGKFTANSNSITIKSTAKIRDINDGSVRTNSSVSYTVTLYKYVAGSPSVAVGSYYGSANGRRASGTFTVSANSTYYFEISVDTSLNAQKRLHGTGTVSPVTVL